MQTSIKNKYIENVSRDGRVKKYTSKNDRIITDKMHPLGLHIFHGNLCCMKIGYRMHLVCSHTYCSCGVLFDPTIPTYFFSLFVFYT